MSAITKPMLAERCEDLSALKFPVLAMPPKYRFDTLAAAVEKAELMMENIGYGTMFVMKAAGGVQTTKETKYVAADAETPLQKARVVRSKDR